MITEQMKADELVETMARRIALADAKDGSLPILLESESYMAKARDLATAALDALRETHHLVPRATGDDGELVEWLREFGPTAKTTTDQNLMDQAADRIEALTAEVERKGAEIERRRAD